MKRSTFAATLLIVLISSIGGAQDQGPLLPDKDTMLLTVFLKHDQTMNNVERRVIALLAGTIVCRKHSQKALTGSPSGSRGTQ